MEEKGVAIESELRGVERSWTRSRSGSPHFTEFFFVFVCTEFGAEARTAAPPKRFPATAFSADYPTKFTI